MLETGQILQERYRISGPLAQGGMGTIYLATDLQQPRVVVIKESLCDDEAWRHALRREAELLARLQHPALPRIYGYFEEGSGGYIVMEFISGDDLRAILNHSNAPLAVAEVATWAEQLFSVADYLHQQPRPILHGDIKPANIKLRNGRIVLLDFGLARQQTTHLTHASTVTHLRGHTQDYAPLEQMRGDATTPASDVYSLSATLYTLFTGHKPPDAVQRAIAAQDPLRDLRALRPEVPANMAQAIMSGLALEPRQRPQSAAQMRQRFFSPPQPARPPRRHKWALAVAGGLMALLLVFGVALAQVAHIVKSRSKPVGELRSVPPGQRGEAVRLTAAALEALQNSDYETALEQARAAVTADPDYALGQAVLGDALWDTQGDAVEEVKELPEVVACADKIMALTTEPQMAEDYAARGWANLVREKYPAAYADADKALEMQPKSVVAYMIRATAATSGRISAPAEDLQRAVADYSEVIRLKPKYAQAYSNLASTNVDLENYTVAEYQAQTASELFPQAAYLYRFGEVYFAAGQFEPAAEQYRQALEDDAAYLPALNSLGSAYFRLNKLNDAAEVLTQAIKLKPNVMAYTLRGHVRAGLEQWSEARADYTAALGLKETPTAYAGRGYVWLHEQRWREAEQDFTEALALDEGNASYYASRAFARYHAGATQKALGDIKEALKLRQEAGPLTAEDAPLYQMQAEILYRLGREGEAEAAHQKARRLTQ